MRRLAHASMYAGVISIVFALASYHAAVIGEYDFTGSSRFGWAIAFALGLCTVAYGIGLPDAPRSGYERISAAFLASALGVLGVSLVQLAVGDGLLPRFVVVGTGLLLVPWYSAVSMFSGAGRRAREQRDRVLVVASPEQVQELERQLAVNPEHPATIVASVSDEVQGSGEGGRALAPLAEENSVSVLVLNLAALGDEKIVEQAAELHEQGVRVRSLTHFYEEWLGKIPLAELERATLFFDIGDLHRGGFGSWKRLCDLVIASVGVIGLLVLAPVVWFANLFGNRGPLLYRQERVGRNGEVFRMIKFRSMRDDPTAQADWTSERDPRITPFGQVLRLTHLDELPQVWNVFRGELSIVGPRPEQPRYVEELAERLPYYNLRHAVRPGLTGWAQVKYGYAGTEGDALEKLQYEFYYLRRQSLSFDIRIVGRTIRAVVGRQGR